VSWNDDIDVGDCIHVYSNESAGHYVIEPDDHKSSHEALLRSTDGMKYNRLGGECICCSILL